MFMRYDLIELPRMVHLTRQTRLRATDSNANAIRKEETSVTVTFGNVTESAFVLIIGCLYFLSHL